MAGVRSMVVWCPDWPVVAVGGDAPVAVVASGRVVACSAAARVEGVQRGLRRRQAEARCPGLVVVPPDPGRDARAFEPVVAAIESFTPRVEIVRPGLCIFATRGPSRYFGGDEALATQVGVRVDEVVAGLFPTAPGCQVGVADGRFAAERAARLPLPASVSDRIVPSGRSAAFLAPYPVATLEDSTELSELLVRLGIRTLGEFAALPAKAVLARFGPGGAVAHRLARGLDERPLATRTPPPDLTVSAELDPPAERLDTVAFAARSLATRLHGELAGRGLGLAVVRIEAETEHGEFLVRTWRLDAGTGPVTEATLAERVRWQLDGWLTGSSGAKPTGPLTLLRLVPDEVAPDAGRQQGFWGGDRAAAERAARAVERLQGRLGPDAVVTAVRVGGRGPGEQVRLVPWGDPPPEGAEVPRTAAATGRARFTGTTSGPPVPPWPGRLPSPAPATVLSPPLRAEVVDGAGIPVAVSGRGSPAASRRASPSPVGRGRRWWPGPGRGRWTSVGGTRPPTAGEPAGRSSPPAAPPTSCPSREEAGWWKPPTTD